MSSEYMEKLHAVLQVMQKEQREQSERMFKMEQQLSELHDAVQDTKDDVREIGARIHCVTKTLRKMDWQALRWRRLDWAALPHPTRRGTLPFLSVEDSMSLNHAVTDHEARPHLMESYRGMRSPAFDQLLYTDMGDYRALRWVMEKGIDLRGFRLEMEGEEGSGVILASLMGWRDEDED